VDVASALLAWPVGYKSVKTTAMGAYVLPGATQVCAGKATPRCPSALLFRASVVSLRACPLRPCGLCACRQLWEVACDVGIFFRHACMRVGHDVVTRRVEDTAARPRGKRRHHLMARSAIIRESGCDGGAVIFSLAALYVIESTGSTTRAGAETITPRTRTCSWWWWRLEQRHGQGSESTWAGGMARRGGVCPGIGHLPVSVVHFIAIDTTIQVRTCY